MNETYTKNIPGGSFICSFPDCHASYNKAHKLEAHLCKHTGSRPFKCDFSNCGKSFATKNRLRRHKVRHTGEKRYRCAEDGCAQTFTTSASVKKHALRHHSVGAKPFTCTFEGCGLAFKKHNQLRTHESTHTLLPPFQCLHEGCGRRFTHYSNMKRHEKMHKGYPCTAEGCTFVAKTWTEMLKHKKEHKVTIQCDQCEKTFRDSWFLRQHQLVHSNERTVFHCPRDACTRSYTSASNLRNHILSYHEGQRSFICSHPGCGKSFPIKVSLKRHAAVHDPERKKRPRPKRSLASRLSGHKPTKKHQTKTSILDQSAPVNQTEAPLNQQLIHHLESFTSDSRTNVSNVTECESSDLQPIRGGSVVSQSKSVCSELSTAGLVVNFLEPLLL